MNPRPTLTLVTPAYNEALSLPALHARLCEVLGPGSDWELLVVNDGSTDDTWRVVDELHARDPRVKGLHLLVNGGHTKALVAGLDYADGDLVITLDADLQHPPEVIPRIVAAWREGALLVNTIRRETTREGFFKKLSSRLYYQVFKSITGIPIRPGMADFRGIDRTVVDLVRRYREETLPLRFLLAKLPFRSAEIDYEPAPRFAGRTKYTLRKMLVFASESLFGFSLAPLYFGYLVGLVFLALFLLYGLYVLYVHVVLHEGIPGWSSQILVTLIASAVQFLLLGILGGYVGSISREVRHRPRYVVGGLTGLPDPPSIRTPAP
jgi:glycosyltransferase involved in cell wall biosynthesis